MTALLALLGALAYGCSDFGTSFAARRDRPEAVTLVVFVASGVAVMTAVWFVDAPAVHGADLWWGAVAGVVGGIGFLVFIQAMAKGAMSVIAPLTAVISAATSAVFGLVAGERPSALNLLGIAFALVAIGLVSRPSTLPGAATASGVAILYAVLAGVGFGLFFVVLSYTEDDAGLWPLVPARVVSVSLLVVINLVRYRGIRVERRSVPIAIGSGLVEATAVILLLLAVRRGPLAIAGVLGSLYPASTVLLAWWLLAERLGRTQKLGVALALVAVALTAA